MRLTPAIVRVQKTEALSDLLDSIKSVLRVERTDPRTIAPSDLAKAKRDHRTVRAELLKRGEKKELVDWEPEQEAA